MKKYKRIILCGPAAAGKDWARQYLEELGYIYATSYTSRPMRPGEVDGVDYHFLTDEVFANMIQDGLFYEYIKFGYYFYGTTNLQMKRCSLFIMTPGGISLLKPEDRIESLVVYLNPHTNIRQSRLNERNDDISKSQKRIDLDKIEFDNFTDFDVEFTNPETMQDDFHKFQFKVKQRPIVYVDMDGVVADFDSMIKTYNSELETSDKHDNFKYREDLVDAIMEANPRSFLKIQPIPDSIAYVKKIARHFDVYFLSTPMQNIPESYMDKRIWLKLHFGEWANRRLILTHRKDLNIGDYLIDDRLKNGAAEFTGKHIHIYSAQYPTLLEVWLHLKNDLNNDNI